MFRWYLKNNIISNIMRLPHRLCAIMDHKSRGRKNFVHVGASQRASAHQEELLAQEDSLIRRLGGELSHGPNIYYVAHQGIDHHVQC